MNPALILIDGSSYFYRAFHALPPLMTSTGKPTGAIYGVANMIKRLIKDYPESQIVVVFDAQGKTFRDELYPHYKAHREATPPDLSGQFQPLYDLLEAMGLPILVVNNVEADDVIGTLSTQASSQGYPVLISTGDKDMVQLVNPLVRLINTMTNQILDEAAVIDKFGIRSTQFIDYLTLMGDSIDNIPGVVKCGPKTASKWLQGYDTLENLLSHAEEITGKIGESLRASRAYLPLSKQLVTIKTDVELPLSVTELKSRAPDLSRLIGLTQSLEFKRWTQELLEQAKQKTQEREGFSADAKEANEMQSAVTLITEKSALTHLLDRLRSEATVVAVHTVADRQNPFTGVLAGIGLAMNEGQTFYIPLASNLSSSREEILSILKGYLQDSAFLKIGHNLKFDYHLLQKEGITLKGLLFDTMLGSYVLNSNATKHDRESLALKYLDYRAISYEKVVGKGSKQQCFNDIALEQAATYVGDVLSVIYKLYQQLDAQLPPSLKKILSDIEMPLLTVLSVMEEKGVLIDQATLANQGKRLQARILELETEALELAGESFNLNSPKQLQVILFDRLALPVVEKTPKGQPSTAEAVLQELASDYRLPAVILEHRSLTKLLSTYIEAIPKCIHPTSGRVHTCYNQAIAATGRLSSSDPNLQNIPVRTEEGRLIRKAFVAPPGYKLISADYSQIELRIMAHLSADKNLLEAFQQDLDIHAATASEIFQVPLEKVSHEQRRRSKAINFGLIYGMSAFGLAKQLGIDSEEAQHYMTTYFERYPGVLSYMERTRRQAHQQGYVETLFGRRLYLPEINAHQVMRRKAAERMAINAPMQGTAADIIKKAMLDIAKWQLNDSSHAVNMIMQVHDELVFEVKTSMVDEVMLKVRQIMEGTAQLSVPLKVSIGVGANWDEAH
ncbi:MAG: DNA polymerase I [Legionella sp.]|nr:DNA polymerase I [Legionella sp.]